MGNRLRQVSLSEASPEIRKIYQNSLQYSGMSD
jgi:hypothetical protein